MAEIVKCKCHTPRLNLIILPFLTTNNEAFAAVCPAKPPTVYIKEEGEWQQKEGWKIENGQIFEPDGKPFQLPVQLSENAQPLPATRATEEITEETPRPGGRKPAAGTRVDLSRDDYY